MTAGRICPSWAEVKDPQRTLPLALIFGTGCIMPRLSGHQSRVHLSAAAAADGRVEVDCRGCRGAHPSVRRNRCGGPLPAGRPLIYVQWLNATMMTGPRNLFAMAEARAVLPQRGAYLAAVPEPVGGDLAGDGLGVLYVLENDFAQLRRQIHPRDLAVLRMAVAGVFVLRRKRPDLPGLQGWGYPFVPLLFLLAIRRHGWRMLAHRIR